MLLCRAGVFPHLSMSTHAAIAATALCFLESIRLPTHAPGPDEVLVEAKYAALQPLDGYQLNYGFILQPSDYPLVLGFAGSGIVKDVGTNVTHVRAGDRVRSFVGPCTAWNLLEQVATMNFPETKSKATQEFSVVHRCQVATVGSTTYYLHADRLIYLTPDT